MNRATERERENYIRIKGCSTIYDTRSEANMAKAISKLAAYEDTGLDPCEIVKLKAERDAAVRDIVEAMEADLSMCVLTHQCWFCAFYNSDDCPLEKDGDCAPKWRGPQQENYL